MSASPRSAPSHNPLVSPTLRPTPALPAATPRSAAGLAPLLAAWHLLSLDAPTVAALWVVFVARSAHVALRWTDAAAMFTAVWILYAADRLLDARGLRTGADPAGLEARHRFHDRHRAWFYAAFTVACPLLLCFLRYVERPALRLDLILGSLLFAWLLLVHARPGSWSRLPKEIAVGVFFPAAVFLPSVARAPWLRPALLPDALLFAAVCSLNCLYIFAWEHPDRHHAHWSTRWSIRRLPQLTWMTLAGSALAVVCFASRALPSPGAHRLLALPALACAGSAGLLLLLDRHREQVSPISLRAAADACLLTPFLLLAILQVLTST